MRGRLRITTDEGELLGRLRAGDEEAFACLVDRYHAAMVRLARTYVRSQAVAEEVAQEAWLGLLRGLDRFEGRSSLRTWLYRIVANRAISTGLHERQHLPVDDSELEEDGGRFSQDGWWVTPRFTGPTRPSTAWSLPNWRPGCASSWRTCRWRNVRWSRSAMWKG